MDLQRRGSLYAAFFTAMACDCEILIDCDDPQQARALGEASEQECRRIERKFSRYRDDNVVHAINRSSGQPLCVDDETADLLDFADHCWRISDGLFDITSGILRRIWRFDGCSPPPSRQDSDALLPLIGWQHVDWTRPQLRLPPGMEIDFGGIGKEYAVDRVLGLLTRQAEGVPLLVNFGGDLACNRPQRDGRRWTVGIGHPDASDQAVESWRLSQGALATSGDAHRHILYQGIRYGHVLNPKTGWPTPGAPRSVTVAAPRCLDAGILSTLALLQGAEAESFLQVQQVPYRILA